MTTRMEKVAEDVALAVLRNTGPSADSPLQSETVVQAFQARWPSPDSRTPMNDAMSAVVQAAISCVGVSGDGVSADSWDNAVYKAWQSAVQETVCEYFKKAGRSFQKGQHLEGAEILADAVRATLGHIASVRNWPHSTHGDLYSIVAALISRSKWPETEEEFDQALSKCSKEGRHLASALGASMGLPDSINFGTYAKNPEVAEENALSFAETVIELANRLAEQTPART